MKTIKLNQIETKEDEAVIYAAMAYRSENTADPITSELSYHLTFEAAEAAAKEINLEVGFSAITEHCIFDLEEVTELFESKEEIELSDLTELYHEKDNTIEVATNEGTSVVGDVIISWNYEKYVGYARNFSQIGYGGQWPFNDFKYESDLITGNEESNFRTNYSVLLTADELSGLTDQEILDACK